MGSKSRTLPAVPNFWGTGMIRLYAVFALAVVCLPPPHPDPCRLKGATSSNRSGAHWRQPSGAIATAPRGWHRAPPGPSSPRTTPSTRALELLPQPGRPGLQDHRQHLHRLRLHRHRQYAHQRTLRHGRDLPGRDVTNAAWAASAAPTPSAAAATDLASIWASYPSSRKSSALAKAIRDLPHIATRCRSRFIAALGAARPG